MAPQPPKFNLLELLSIICSGVGFLMAIIGTITTCSCSTSKSFLTESESFGVSLSWLIVLFAVIIAAAGIVLAIMALKQKGAAIKADKIAKLAFIVGVTAVVFGLLPLFTMCGYTCSLNSTIGSYR